MQLVLIFAFLLGDWLLQQHQDLPESWMVVPLLSIVIVSWRVQRLRWLAGGTAGFLWAWLHGYLMLSDRLPSAWEGHDALIKGQIAAIPKNFGPGIRFDLDTLTMTIQGETFPWRRKLRIVWYKSFPELLVGESWQLSIRLNRPHGLMNPGGFDTEGWLWRNGIHALGTVRHQPPAIRLATDPGPYYFVDRFRQHLAIALAHARPGSPYLGLLQGLAIGETGAITHEQWETLARTGTTHLLAISGSHIALIAGFAYFVVRRLWAWSGRAPLWCAAPQMGAMAAMVAALGYALVAGLPISTQRAAIMVSVAMIALLINRAVQPAYLLAQAIFIVLLWDPLAVVDAGFWLSFSAVALIWYVIGGRVGSRARWRTFLRIQWGITIGLTPLLLALFHQIALYSPLANLIAIPWLELGTVPVLLLGTLLLPIAPSLGTGLVTWADMALAGLWPILEFCATLPAAIWAPPTLPAWAVGIGIGGALLLLAPRGFPGRWLGVIGLAPLALLPNPQPSWGELWLTVLDVGQGLGVVVRTATHTLIYDAGSRLGGFDAGSMVIVPFLRYRGISSIDTVLISHADNDHSGGIAALLAAFPAPRRLLGAGGEPCQQGITWNWDGIAFRTLHPPTASGFSGNDASCVLRISWQDGALLLTGDISRTAEESLLHTSRSDLRATVLVAPHHGSRRSSTPAFVTAVTPQVVIYTTGYRNRFGFPHPEVVARYTAVGSRSLDTAQYGAIELRLGRGLMPTAHTWREEARHYWNWVPLE